MTFRRNAGLSSGVGGSSQPPRPEFVVRDPAPAEEAEALPAFTSAEESRPPYVLEREARPAATAPDKCANVIATGSRWEGSLAIDDSVRIDGRLNGDIDAKGTIHISEGAVVEAKIKAAFVVISGTFKGEVRCLERLELLPKSKIQGEVITKVLNVHEGALVDGNIRMSGDKAGEALKGWDAADSAAAEPERNGARPARS
jgi:cytoskeletal protein CcmA (bactofilin family)